MVSAISHKLHTPPLTSADQNGAIGIFDSGVGGLSVARHVKELMPNESIVYIADSAYAPYGCKSAKAIEARSFEITQLLISKGVKAIVIACNTATVSAISRLREKFSLPIIGIEPGVKPAAQSHEKVAVLSTEQTSKSNQLATLIERFGNNTEVIVQPCPGLVEQVESLELNSNQTATLLHDYLTPLYKQQVTCIVLGCTHYPFLTEQIASFFDYDIEIIDTGAAVARETKRRLEQSDLLRSIEVIEKDVFYGTGTSHSLQTLLTQYWPQSFQVQTLARG